MSRTAASLLIFVLASFAVPGTRAQDRQAAHREIYLYQGAGRAQRLPSQGQERGRPPPHNTMAPDNLLFFVMGYNTKLVKAEDVPKSYEDLLQPRWSGNFGIEASDIIWFAAVAKAMGEEEGLAYFRKLAAMKPQIRSGHTLMTELVAAGEIPVVLTLYNQAVDKLKERGAPIDWKPLPPAFGRADGIGVAKQAPHPHAALLFADFVLSPEGQRFIMAASRVPVNRKVGSSFDQRNFRIVELAPVVDEWDTWERRWQTLFLKGQK